MRWTGVCFGDKLVDWELIKLAGGQPDVFHDAVVLEIGPGVGVDARIFNEGTTRYICLDNDPEVLQSLESLAPAIEIVDADCRKLPLEDRSIDTVIDFSSIDDCGSDISDLHRAYAEVARILRPGGLFLTTFATNKSAPANSVRQDVHVLVKHLKSLGLSVIARTSSPGGERAGIVAKKSSHITIHGLGYVGLTAAVHWAKAGWGVLGYDPDETTVAGVNAGHPRAGEFLGYIDEAVASLGICAYAKLGGTVARSPVHSVAVPTERSGEPYDDIVIDSVRRIARVAPPGTTILIESTLTPGTTDRILSFINRESREDLSIAVCPRRDWFADENRNLENLPRVVGGVTPNCTVRAKRILSSVSHDIRTTDYRTAELCKALENALLHIPVMFGHELALHLPDHNVAEALRLAASHWRIPEFYVGFGTAGRCVSMGTKYLQTAMRDNGNIAGAALDLEQEIRKEVADVVIRNGCKDALILGVAYRPEFRDAGLSPGLAIARHLEEAGIEVTIHDPMWTDEELSSLFGFRSVHAPLQMPDPLLDWDAVLLATPHRCYDSWPRDCWWTKGQLVLDANGAWRHKRRLLEHADYRVVGEPGWRR